jgi:hypothetical protein
MVRVSGNPVNELSLNFRTDAPLAESRVVKVSVDPTVTVDADVREMLLTISGSGNIA